MRGSSQKGKFVRRPSANSRESSSSQATQDRLQDLRNKIEKDRDAMRSTGRRFNKTQETASEAKIAVEDLGEGGEEKTKAVTPFLKREGRVAEVAATQQRAKEETAVEVNPVQAQPQQPQRKNVQLAELIPQVQQPPSLSSSRLFEREVSEQKNRNQEIRGFLEGIGLAEYAEGLINMGYDELEVLVEVTAEELNFLMMRAAHQRRLTEALARLRGKAGGREERAEPLMGLPAFFKSRAGMRAPEKPKTSVGQSSLSSRPKSAVTEASTIPTNNSQMFGSCTFFCGIGGNEWSMESLVRRACSGCFRVFPSSDLQQRQDCYYCPPCSRVEDDVVGITLNGSMLRDYSHRP